MEHYTTIFKQMLMMIPWGEFSEEAKKEGYNRYTKHFTVKNQFITILYAQFSDKKSLRDLETGLKVQYRDWNHLGLKNVSRSQLSYVNKRRSYKIFRNLYNQVYERCVSIAPRQRFRFKNRLQLMDSTLIEMCASVFPWAEYKQQKGALKIHTLLDERGTIPSFVVMSPGKEADITIAKESNLPLFPDSILVMDRGYTDFEWFNDLDKQGIYFVTRAKENLKYRHTKQSIKWHKIKTVNDLTITLTGTKTKEKYPHSLRLIKIINKGKKKRGEEGEETEELKLLTNNFKLAASTIAQIYKSRWDIELFFKWIKQNLKIKTFLGTSENAVLTQIWIALIYYLLLAYIKFQTRYKFSLLHLSRVIREGLFKKIHLIDILNINPKSLKKTREPCQQRILIEV